MKRHSQLAMIRTVINSTRLRMARLLGISESLYEKAEINEKSLPLAAMVKLRRLSEAFESTIKIHGIPQGLIPGKRSILPNFRRQCESKLRRIKQEISRYKLSLHFITDNWTHGLQQLYFIQVLKTTIGDDDESYKELERNIATLEAVLVQYSPARQQNLQQLIKSLEEQERALSGILNVE